MNAIHPVPTVEQVMTPDPILVHANEPLQSAAQRMEDNEVSGVPVVDENGVLVGVLADSDLVRARATKRLWATWPNLAVRHLMHAPVLTAARGMDLEEAASLMERAHIHRLIVLDDDQQTPIGVISTSDLVRAIVGEHRND
jgi:acetoin utilization protein AcuB